MNTGRQQKGMRMSERQLRRARELAPDMDGFREHTFRECQVCGHLVWKGAHTSDEEIFHFEPWTDDYLLSRLGPCPRCEEVRQMAPEVVHWVLDVLDMFESKKRNIE